MRIGMVMPHEIIDELRKGPHKNRPVGLCIGSVIKEDGEYYTLPYNNVDVGPIQQIDISGKTNGYEYSLDARIKTAKVFTKRDIAEMSSVSMIEDVIEDGLKVKGTYFKNSRAFLKGLAIATLPATFSIWVINALCNGPKWIGNAMDSSAEYAFNKDDFPYECKIHQPKKGIPKKDEDFMKELSSFIYSVETSVNRINQACEKNNLVSYDPGKGKTLFLYKPKDNSIECHQTEYRNGAKDHESFIFNEIPVVTFLEKMVNTV